jgi:hypothetical protein
MNDYWNLFAPRVALAWEAIVHGQGQHAATAREAVEHAHANGEGEPEHQCQLSCLAEGAKALPANEE